MTNQKKLLLIDGSSVAFRAFFALYNQIDRFRNNNGLHTNAIYGFHLMLDNLLERIQPTHVLVAFDAGKTTFRTEMFADYKAGRAKTPEEFREQFPYIREMLAARGIAYYDLAQYEADDIIGTLAKMAENTSEDYHITVVSGDKDLIQLTDENTVVEISKKGVAEFEAFTPDYLMEKMGITPAQFIDLKSLMGDKSDNIPGVTKIGEKTGLKLLLEHGSLEGIYEHIDEMKKSKMKENLINDKEQAFLSKTLATIDTQSPIEIGLDDTAFTGPDLEKLAAFYDEMGFVQFKNGLDIQSISWLEDFLIDFENTVIVVSHDRHFLNKVCTHMADLDFGKIKLYVGNYDFWKQSSELAARLQADRNAKAEEKIKELQEFVARFSANASKSKQATSRKKMLDKIELEEIVPSSRKYPFINFNAEREIGNDLLTVENLTVKMDGETILDNISFILRPGDKTAIIGQNDIQTTALIRALAGDIDYEGTIKWGVTTSRSYLPKDNSKDFASGESILEWLRQFAEKGEDDDTFLRGFLGRMLFSGDEVNKSVSVLSGGEKVRVMLSKLMLLKSNVLLLDDPTNHLDLESISSLNDGVRDFKESVIFASHDHEFIQTIANHIVVVSKNGVIDRIDETYDEFLENEEVQAKVKALWAD